MTTTPDFVYDPDGWEETYMWRDRNYLVEDQLDRYEQSPIEYATLIKGPPMWAVRVALTRDENGDPDETEIRWFTSLEEAQAAR